MIQSEDALPESETETDEIFQNAGNLSLLSLYQNSSDALNIHMSRDLHVYKVPKF